MLIARGHSLPAGKEGWSHPGTAQMLYAELQPLGYSERERRKWQSDLEDLYRARVASDYVASIVIGEAEVIKASELSDEILDLVEKHLA